MSTPEVILVPLIIGLVEVAKQVGLPKIFIPLMSLAVAQFIGYFIGIDWIQAFVLGLTACGLWSGTKATLGK